MVGTWTSKITSAARGHILGVSLCASLLVHVALFLALQKTFPFSWEPEMRTYQVEFLRPPIQDLEKDPGTGAEIRPTQENDENLSAEDQETISLDTKDHRYVNYAGVIKDRIMKQWRYPPEAKASLMEGKLRVAFSLKRSGEMDKVKVQNSSGFPLLDEEAVKAIRAGAPYPPFPEHVTVKRLNIDASFEYRLKTSH